MVPSEIDQTYGFWYNMVFVFVFSVSSLISLLPIVRFPFGASEIWSASRSVSIIVPLRLS